MANLFFHPVFWPLVCLVAGVVALLILDILEKREKGRCEEET